MSLVVDLFAGGGGASIGIEKALGRPIDVALNHSWEALRNHALNHPHTRHLVDDIRDVHPLVATRGEPVALLWASPDCKHFSRCKGGRPLEDSIRTLPWEVVRWARETQPEVIAMENVPEFVTWGPLDDTGRPIKSRAGETYREWRGELEALGYTVDHRELSACDYGAPTSRRRWFLVARRDGQPVRWPEPTHGPESESQTPYRTAFECVDWSDLGASVFDPKRRKLAAKTMRRVAMGLVRFALAESSPYLVQTGYGERKGQLPRCMTLNAPLGTIVAGGQKHGLCVPWIVQNYGGMVGYTPARPLNTITARDSQGLACAQFEGVDRAREVGALVLELEDHLYAMACEKARKAAEKAGRPYEEPERAPSYVNAAGVVEVGGAVVVDVSMRMLQPHELQQAQGFPCSYVLEGTKQTQVRLIGNSVSPQVAQAIVGANLPRRERKACA